MELVYFLMEHIVNCHWLKNRIMELRLISAELRSQSPDWKCSAAPLIRALAGHQEHRALSPHPQTAFMHVVHSFKISCPLPLGVWLLVGWHVPQQPASSSSQFQPSNYLCSSVFQGRKWPAEVMYYDFAAFAKWKDILNVLLLQKDNQISLKKKACNH